MSREVTWNKEKGCYELTQFADIEKAKEYIDTIALTNLVIKDNDDYKAVWDSRTLVNNTHRDISEKRKKMTAVIMSLFEPTFKELENYLLDKSNTLTAMLNEFKPPKVREKKAFKLEATFDNAKALERVKKYALKYGAVIK